MSGDPMDGSKDRVQTLKVKQADGSTQVAEKNAEKGQMLQDMFFLKPE